MSNVPRPRGACAVYQYPTDESVLLMIIIVRQYPMIVTMLMMFSVSSHLHPSHV